MLIPMEGETGRDSDRIVISFFTVNVAICTWFAMLAVDTIVTYRRFASAVLRRLTFPKQRHQVSGFLWTVRAPSRPLRRHPHPSSAATRNRGHFAPT
jgi:hypothetical protein